MIKNSGLGIKRSYHREKLMVIVDEANLDMLDELMQQNKWDVKVAYILTDSPVVRTMFPKHSRIYPLNANIRSLLRVDVIDEIVCCTGTLPTSYMNELAGICFQFGVSLLIQSEFSLPKIKVTDFRYLADYCFYVLETNPRKQSGYKWKTMAEIAFALAALLLISPILIMVALAIKTTSKGPVIFMQRRVGLRGRKFYIYKFRTMIVDAELHRASLADLNESDGPAFKIANDPRITAVGRFLRKTGIDELPQLYNVLRGEMSLIGPRPMLPDEVLEQEEWQLKRMCVKPGITCTWQIQPSRNKVPFDEWMQLDREYIENWSALNDVRIFFATIRSMVFARGV